MPLAFGHFPQILGTGEEIDERKGGVEALRILPNGPCGSLAAHECGIVTGIVRGYGHHSRFEVGIDLLNLADDVRAVAAADGRLARRQGRYRIGVF